MDLGDRLQEWVSATYGDANNVTVASKGRLRQSSVYGWMRGVSKPSADALVALRDLGCSTEWLLVGVGSMYSETESGRFWAEKNGYKPPKPTVGVKVQDLVKEIETVLEKYRR